MNGDVIWERASKSGDEALTSRRLAQVEAILAEITCGVAVLEPNHRNPGGSAPTMRVVMVNDVASCYFGSIIACADPLAAAEAGLRRAGLLDTAMLVSVTGHEHMVESLPAPGAAAAGNLVDLSLSPLDDGTVIVTFQDTTHLRRHQPLNPPRNPA